MIIENRKGKNVSIAIDGDENISKLAFVMHGLGGFRKQPHIRVLVDALKKKGYTVISFDTTNTFGESEGDYSDATVTNYYEDLEDVIHWAKCNFRYKDQFVLVGHSVGGLSIVLFAEKNPGEVKALALLSAVVSGKLWRQAQNSDMLRAWKRDGVWVREATAFSKKKVLKWAFAEDIMKYNLLDNINTLSMPILLIVGDQDATTPIDQQKIFFAQLPGKKEIHVLKGAGHVFRDEVHLDEVNGIVSRWIESI